ncbi:hypothetical protein EfmAA242_13790 [Enterococcus faecium]|nr:hypothetical protein EfmAA242_13790 [Enterococcus faecium]
MNDSIKKMLRITEKDLIAICALIACEEASAKNQIAIVCDSNARGANFVVTDKPTGERHNSAITTMKKLPNNHNGNTIICLWLCA